MVNYRRVKIAGGTYFFTVTLINRQSNFLTEHFDLLQSSVRRTQERTPFNMLAYVVLPEHLHCIWKLPEDDDNYASRWRSIKSSFTQKLYKAGIPLHKNHRGEFDLWQRRYWEHAIRNESDLHRHIDYIHYNPVKHGWTKSVKDWPYSSFHRFVEQGMLDAKWGSNEVIDITGSFGE